MRLRRHLALDEHEHWDWDLVEGAVPNNDVPHGPEHHAHHHHHHHHNNNNNNYNNYYNNNNNNNSNNNNKSSTIAVALLLQHLNAEVQVKQLAAPQPLPRLH